LTHGNPFSMLCLISRQQREASPSMKGAARAKPRFVNREETVKDQLPIAP